jgi:segregation and condensation protein B
VISIDERRQQKLTYLEAALYSSGHPLNMDEMMQAVDTKSEKVVLRFVETLSKKLDERRCALEVKLVQGNRAVMRLRTKYSSMVRQFTNKPLLTTGPLKTLGFVAYNQPVDQPQVLNYRGVHVYSQLKLLEEMGLISREKTEKGVVIRTTSFFSDYFGFSSNPTKAREQIIEQFSMLHPKLLEEGVKVSEENIATLTNTRDRLT